MDQCKKLGKDLQDVLKRGDIEFAKEMSNKVLDNTDKIKGSVAPVGPSINKNNPLVKQAETCSQIHRDMEKAIRDFKPNTKPKALQDKADRMTEAMPERRTGRRTFPHTLAFQSSKIIISLYNFRCPK